MAVLTGTLTLNPVTLPATADTVYLLADEDLGTGGLAATSLYEASLDGGTTWETVTPGTLNQLAHTGTSLQIRVTLNLDDTSDQVGTVKWIVAYGTQEA
jgi:hypothetical protein